MIGLEIYGEDGLLRSLAVAANALQTGVGRELVGASEQHAQAKGIKQLYLLTETAIPFFAKLGFEAIARNDAAAAIKSTEEFTSLCSATAIVMRKRYP